MIKMHLTERFVSIIAVAMALGAGGLPSTAARAFAETVAEAPTSIADLAPAPIPDEDNAAAQIEALSDQARAWEQDQARFDRTPLGMAYADARDRDTPPTAQQAEAMRAILDEHADLALGVQRAAACDQYASRADFTLASGPFIDDLLRPIQRARSFARFACWQMQLLTHDGQHDEAVRHGIDLLKLARLRQEEPMLVNYFTTLALRFIISIELYDALNAGPVSFKTHLALDAELALADDPATFTHVLRTERAYALTVEAENAGPFGITLPGVGVGDGAGRYLAALIKASEAPWPTFRQGVKQGGKWLAPTGYGVMADNLSPTVESAVGVHGRNLAVMRSLRAFNALRLFAKLNKREATGLEEVDLPAEALVDPFADAPLRARLTPEGWLIYSVMANEQDDGGDFREMLDYGVTPPGDRRAQ